MPRENDSGKFLAAIVPLSFVLFLVSSLFMGCEKEVEVLVHDTVRVEIVVEVISVDTVIALNEPVEGGGTLELTATVTAGSDAGALTYQWFATAGAFDDAEGDTVTWTAPDSSGPVTVTVHVTDGVYIGIGSQNIGVGMYAPTVDPHYLGAAGCAVCHTSGERNQYTTWVETGHANAWADLQASGHAASYCEGCHTVGTQGLADPVEGDAGWDDARISAFQNVQCENCHGPGSDHAASLSKADITISFDAAVCGDCHSGSRNPTFGEWGTSGHGNVPGYPQGNSSCQGCHEGVAASIRLSGDLSAYYGSGAVATRPTVEVQPLAQLTCATCHNPHDATNEHQLRTVAAVQLIDANGVTPAPITAGGAGKLCMQCHHARHSGDEHIPEGDAHFGPHHSNQADMLAGQSANIGVAAAGFNWAQPSHLYIDEACVTCHMHEIEFDTVLPDSAATGHTFEPTVTACQQCHGSINSFDEIMALDDFDGDGSIEGVQSEVAGLMDLLVTALIDSFNANGITTTGWDADSLHGAIGTVKHARAPGDTLVVPVLWREAGYNWVFVLDDGSHGVHNPDYTVQLLQQSYKHLTGVLPPAAPPVLAKGTVVGSW